MRPVLPIGAPVHRRIECKRCANILLRCHCPGGCQPILETLSGCVACMPLDDAEAAEQKASRLRDR